MIKNGWSLSSSTFRFCTLILLMQKLNLLSYLRTLIHGASMYPDLILIPKVTNQISPQKGRFLIIATKVLSLELVFTTLVQCSTIRAIQMPLSYPLA